MHITEAQYEMRRAFLGGSWDNSFSGILWLISAGLATWSTPGRGIWFLVIAGMFIFPLTQFGLKLMGRPGKVAPITGSTRSARRSHSCCRSRSRPPGQPRCTGWTGSTRP